MEPHCTGGKRKSRNIAIQSHNLAKQSKTIARSSKEIAEDARRIAAATRRDSTSMKAIAALTMVFLPFTFVAVSPNLFAYLVADLLSRVDILQTLFAMPMLNWQSASNQKVLSKRSLKYFRIYWGTATPLTIIVLIVWTLWILVSLKKQKKEEKQLEEEWENARRDELAQESVQENDFGDGHALSSPKRTEIVRTYTSAVNRKRDNDIGKPSQRSVPKLLADITAIQPGGQSKTTSPPVTAPPSKASQSKITTPPVLAPPPAAIQPASQTVL
jgi:hypothetical protein